MVASGEWTVDGSAADLRLLSVRLKATGQVGLRRNLSSAFTVATKPARQAVKVELERVMPKAGGANEFLARSTIRSSTLTGPRTAGVAVRAYKKGRDWDSINRGRLRHPVYGHRDRWADTEVSTGWWEHALAPFGPAVQTALLIAMNKTAREAGFI